MFIAAFVLFIWTALAWFSGPFATPPFALEILRPDPAALLLCALLALVGGVCLHLVRSGFSTLNRWRGLLSTHRSTALILLAILCAHAALELPFILLPGGANDADSAGYGLSAYRIAEGEMRPMFSARKHHYGSFVPHICASMEQLFGKDPRWLRLITSLFYLGFIALLFALMIELFADTTLALLAAFIAAIPGSYILWALKYPEYSDMLFWGTLSLLLLARITRRDNPGAATYFWLGAVLGFGFWLHYQMLFFIVTAFFALLVRRPLFFTKAAPWATLPGMALGSAVIYLDMYYYGPWIAEFVIGKNLGSGGFLDRIPAGLYNFAGNIPVFLGVRISAARDVFTSVDILHPILTLLAVLGFGVVAIAALWPLVRHHQTEMKDARFRSGTGFIFLFIVSSLAVISISRYAFKAPMRYELPLWIGIIGVIVIGSTVLGRRWNGARPALIAAFAALLAASAAYQVITLAYRETAYQQFMQDLRARHIGGFYGSWLRTQWIQFASGEEIVGSASYPLSWMPFIGDHERVTRAPGNRAFLFDWGNEAGARAFIESHLVPLHLTWRQESTPFGPLVHSPAVPLTDMQMTGIQQGDYSADCTLVETEALPGGEFLFHFRVRNAGTVPWSADGRNGYCELVLTTVCGERRWPLSRDLAAGGEIIWPALGGPGPAHAAVMQNGIAIGGAAVPEIHPETLHSPDAVIIREADLMAMNEAWVDGWGAVTIGKRRITRWSGAPSAAIAIVAPGEAAATITLTAVPFKPALKRAPEQVLRFELDGVRLPGMVVFSARKSFTIHLDARQASAGVHILRIFPRQMEAAFNPMGTDARLRFRPAAFGIEAARISFGNE